MTNDAGERAALANALARFTQSTLRETGPDNVTRTVKPSLRSIERATGIAHQRLSDFMRNPESATVAMMARVRTAIESPAAAIRFEGQRVGYLDAPRFTRDVLANLPELATARAFRIVVATPEEGYKGYRSTGWVGDVSRLPELAEFAPGGYANIARILFDVGD